jgi:hypothetical protein
VAKRKLKIDLLTQPLRHIGIQKSEYNLAALKNTNHGMKAYHSIFVALSAKAKQVFYKPTE